jgi:hypothetical protein
VAGYRGHVLHRQPERTRADELDELGFERSPRLTYAELRGSDLDAARTLAEAHRELAAALPVDSRVRALALRCGDHWGRLAGLPPGLREVDPSASR